MPWSSSHRHAVVLALAAGVAVLAAPPLAARETPAATPAEPGEATPDLDVTPREDPVKGLSEAIETETNPLEDKRIQPVINTTWVKHCGGCHVAYQPTLLPAKSWTAILEDLPNHYGEVIPPPPPGELRDLIEYSRINAGRPGYGILVDVDANDVPRRITDLPYFRTAHQDVAEDSFNAAGGAWRCESCHQGAGRGFYDRDAAQPGFVPEGSEAVEGLPGSVDD